MVEPALACLHFLARASRRSSRVSNSGQVLDWKARSLSPRFVVSSSKTGSVMSLCMRNFANACQWAK